jgi:hypothetical protein
LREMEVAAAPWHWIDKAVAFHGGSGFHGEKPLFLVVLIIVFLELGFFFDK